MQIDMPQPCNISCFIQSGHCIFAITKCYCILLQEFTLHSDCLGIVTIPEIYKYVTSVCPQRREQYATIYNSITLPFFTKKTGLPRQKQTTIRDRGNTAPLSAYTAYRVAQFIYCYMETILCSVKRRVIGQVSLDTYKTFGLYCHLKKFS